MKYDEDHVDVYFMDDREMYEYISLPVIIAFSWYSTDPRVSLYLDIKQAFKVSGNHAASVIECCCCT